MAKQGGLGDRFFIAQFNISGDVGLLEEISGPQDMDDVTGIDKSGKERLGLTRDGVMVFKSFFNDAAGQAHPALKTLPTTDVLTSYFRGAILGNPSACQISKQTNYDGTRNENGSLSFKTEAKANGFGQQWGNQLTAGVRTDSGATNGAGVDFGAGSSFGLQAFLHVFAFTGTSAVVKLQESQNDGGADPYADVTGGAFTTVTAVHAGERIATSNAQAIERWLRVVTTGTFSNLQFAVVVVRNELAGQVF